MLFLHLCWQGLPRHSSVSGREWDMAGVHFPVGFWKHTVLSTYLSHHHLLPDSEPLSFSKPTSSLSTPKFFMDQPTSLHHHCHILAQDTFVCGLEDNIVRLSASPCAPPTLPSTQPPGSSDQRVPLIRPLSV